MAFPRKFRREIWYMRLPSGEVELTTPTALEASFRCGLVDARTPVRAFGAHVWSTLGTEAEIDAGPTSIASFAPVALDAPAPDLYDGAIWRSRNDTDPKSFKPHKGPILGGLMAVVAIVVVAALEMRLPTNDLDAHIAAARAADEAVRTAVQAVHARPENAREMLRTVRHPERLTTEERRRLRDADYIRRLSTPKPTPRPPTTRATTPAKSEPFSSSTSRWDPLNGHL